VDVMTVIQLLGRPNIRRSGGRGSRPRGRKAWALLAMASLSERPIPRFQLVRMLFPEADDGPAALRWVLSELRRKLRPDAGIDGDPVALDLTAGTVVDAQLVLCGQVDADVEVGELLAGLALPGCPEFELWLAHQRERVAGALQAALRTAISVRLSQRRPEEAVRLARQLVGLEPLEERHHVLLVRSLAGVGDQIGAHAAVGACAALFAKELGVRPSPHVALAALAPPGGVTLLPDGRRLQARLEVEAGKAALAAGAVTDGLERLRVAVAVADGLDDPGIQGEASAALGTAMVHSVALTEPTGVAALRRAAELARVAGDRSTAATASRELGFVAAGARRSNGALLRQARELAVGDDGKLSAVLGIEALTLTDSGRFGAAVQRFRSSVELAERADEPRKAAWSLTMLARAELTAGELAAARTDIDRALALVTAERWTAYLPLVLAVRAELDLHENRLDAAGEQLTGAWMTATRLADPCWLAVTGRGLGLLAARRGNVAEAMQWLDGAYHRTGDLPPLVCRWIDAATIDAICDVATAWELPRAATAVAELAGLGEHAQMPGYVARARVYRTRLDGRRPYPGHPPARHDSHHRTDLMRRGTPWTDKRS
jgi:DNA-binding SARP family transcriptional activator